MADSGAVQVWLPKVEAEASPRRPARLSAESDAVVKSALGSPRGVRHRLIATYIPGISALPGSLAPSWPQSLPESDYVALLHRACAKHAGRSRIAAA